MVTIYKDKTATVLRSASTGDRFIEVKHAGSKYVVPIDIAALGIGKDKWLRNVKINCKFCECVVTVGSTDIAGQCDDCTYSEE